MIRGFDGSQFQNVIDWAAVKQSDMQFAFARATDGAFYDDPQFGRNHDVANQRQFPIGAYHFFRMNSDPIVQANHFIAKTFAVGRLGSVLPMIDVEEATFDGVSLDQSIKETAISNFVHTVMARTGVRTILLYTNYDTWTRFMGNTKRFANLPLWLAQTENPSDGLFGGWTDWLLWQDSTTTVPGIDGPVDLDLLNPAHKLEDILR